MTTFYLAVACILLLISSLLLRKANTVSRCLSLCVFIIAVMCFIAVYGAIGGVFIGVAAALLMGLVTAFTLGKSVSSN